VVLPLLCVIVLLPRIRGHCFVIITLLCCCCCPPFYLDSIRLHQVSSSPFRLLLGVDPFPSVEPIFFHFSQFLFCLRSVPLLFCVLLDMHCSTSPVSERSSILLATYASSPPAITSPSCSGSAATSRRVQVYDAIHAKAYLSSRDGGYRETSYPPAGSL
jgi:hypothetical protein